MPFIGCITIFSDKVLASLYASPLTLYPIHAMFLNFSEEHCRVLICTAKYVVANLLVYFEKHFAYQDIKLTAAVKQLRTSKRDAMIALHGRLEFWL